MQYFLIGLFGCGMVRPVVPGVDMDQDGFGLSVDCDDTNPAVYPGAQERCDDGIDNDCDGVTDDFGEGSVSWYRDNDGDGYGEDDNKRLACATFIEPGWARANGDCDDESSAISPDAAEICDGVDQNCNDQVDEGIPFADWYPDLDGDGFGADIAAMAFCEDKVPGRARNSADCDDTEFDVNPDAPDVCDGVDNDCSGSADDEGVASFDGAVFGALEDAIEVARAHASARVDLCLGAIELPLEYDLDAANDDVTLVGQGIGLTALEPSSYYVPGTGANDPAFLLSGGGSLVIRDTDIVGPGVTYGTYQSWQLVSVEDGEFTLSNTHVTRCPTVIGATESVGDRIVLDISSSVFRENETIMSVSGDAEVSLANVTAENNQPNFALFSFSRNSSMPAAAQVDVADSHFDGNINSVYTFFGQGNGSVLRFSGQSATSSNSTLTIRDSTLNNNQGLSALDARGAVIQGTNVMAEGNLTTLRGGGATLYSSQLSGFTFSNNQGERGGGVYLDGSRLEDVSIVGNTASARGGGIYVTGDEDSSIDAMSVVHNNDAPSGPGAYLDAAGFQSQRADFGDAISSTDNGTGSEIRVVNDDGFLINAFSIVDEFWQCLPNTPCTVTP